jgi:hypothetical protein
MGDEMTKSKNQADALLDVMKNPFATEDASARAQTFWNAQAAAAEHMQSFIDGWFERRREAAAAAAECCGRMFNSGDPSATPAALTEWASGAVERLRTDAQEQAALATQLASDMAGALSMDAAAKPPKERARTEDAKGEPANGASTSRSRPASGDVR